MSLRCACGILLFAALSTAPSRTEAQTSPAEERSLADAISVDAGADRCLDAEAIIRRLAQWLRRDRIGADTHIVIRASADDTWFSLGHGDEPPAERHFDVLPRECSDRVDALTLALAIAIDPSVMDELASEAVEADPPTDSLIPEPGDPADERSSPGDSSSPTAAEPDPPVVPRDEEGPTIEYAFALGGGAGFFVLPSVSALVDAAFELGVAPNLVLRAAVLMSSRHERALGSGHVGLRLAAGRLDLCPGDWNIGRARVDTCLGVGAGALVAQGIDYLPNMRSRRPWLAGIGRLALTIPNDTRFALRLFADVAVPILRPSVHVQNERGEAGETLVIPPASAQVGLEVVVRWR